MEDQSRRAKSVMGDQLEQGAGKDAEHQSERKEGKRIRAGRGAGGRREEFVIHSTADRDG